MNTILNLAFVFVIAACLTSGPVLFDDPSSTIISVPDIHCLDCAKKVKVEVSRVAGVSKVETDVRAKTLKITPKDKSSVSPRRLWDAVKTAGKSPKRLEGPSGVFTSKPTQ